MKPKLMTQNIIDYLLKEVKEKGNKEVISFHAEACDFDWIREHDLIIYYKEEHDKYVKQVWGNNKE